jgi:glycosyltransferase involved in cell wall biosynthesis
MGYGKTWQGIGFLRFANTVIAVSQACADSVARFVAPKRLHVVYNGIPLEKVTLPRDQARANLLAETGYEPDDILITNVAHVCERKGQLYAVDAMTQVIQQVPNARLLLIGSLDREPEYVARVEARITEKSVNSHVKVLGFRENAVQLVSGADMFMHTANKEPHPRAVIEAMGAGMPGVGFAADGVAETILDGQTGYLVPMNDTASLASAVVKLASDSALRQRIGQAGRQRVEACFSAEMTAQQIAAIIDGVLQ